MLQYATTGPETNSFHSQFNVNTVAPNCYSFINVTNSSMHCRDSWSVSHSMPAASATNIVYGHLVACSFPFLLIFQGVIFNVPYRHRPPMSGHEGAGPKTYFECRQNVAS